jgi:hypothetical protein
MYSLTLTGSERDAFDWVGHRYPNGDEMADILKQNIDPENEDDDFDYWNEPGDVEFHVCEADAWIIKDLAEQCDGHWPCFDYELREKMQHFVNQIV